MGWLFVLIHNLIKIVRYVKRAILRLQNSANVPSCACVLALSLKAETKEIAHDRKHRL
ncbi:hypothetical protein TRM7615_01506 [Falsiruegeria mediterranea M17]|jgi:hypothetical protein|uniref:Transposase DDE domain-containing protein n=1 Tax=Falsiruegeria mediterranea M17 TaxID=1200281 RepID=A0A2R8C6F4_9RHOB|nr:hypothetical protein TRM7615_01506 [Falsiruegeria mediterranea M17]